MIQVKFFKGTGYDGLLKIESEVNQWLKDNKMKIEKVETNLCSIADSPGGEMYQYALVSIWYEK